jgi:hypothetical protein
VFRREDPKEGTYDVFPFEQFLLATVNLLF